MTKKTTKKIWAAAPVLGLALVLIGSCGDGDGVSGPKGSGNSVIVIAVDGLSADHLEIYGGTAATPFLSGLAVESVVFEQAWAQSPATLPSLASLMTGLYPTTHGLVNHGDRLIEEAPTLAETFQAAGFATAAFLQTEASVEIGLSQGFGTYHHTPSPGQDSLAWLEANSAGDFLLFVGGWSAAEGLSQPDGMPEGYAERLAESTTSHGTAEPRLLDDVDLDYARAATLKHDEHVDGVLADWVDELRRLDLLEQSTLVIVGTTGVALQEHGNLLDEGLYPKNIRVPLLIRRPGGASNARISKTVELIDVMPTLVEAAGAEAPLGIQGASLLPIIEGGGSPPYVAFSESDQGGGARAVIMDGMLLVSANGEYGLFDLETDPQAGTNVAGEFGDRFDVLESHLEAWSKMVAAASLDPERRIEELDDGTLEQLRSLGYIQ